MSALLARQEEIRKKYEAARAKERDRHKELAAAYAVREAKGDEFSDQDAIDLVDILDEADWTAADYQELLQTVPLVRKLLGRIEAAKAITAKAKEKRAALAIARQTADAIVAKAQRELGKVDTADQTLRDMTDKLEQVRQKHPELFSPATLEQIQSIEYSTSPPEPVALTVCCVCGKEFSSNDGYPFCGHKCAEVVENFREECKALGVKVPKRKTGS